MEKKKNSLKIGPKKFSKAQSECMKKGGEWVNGKCQAIKPKPTDKLKIEIKF